MYVGALIMGLAIFATPIFVAIAMLLLLVASLIRIIKFVNEDE